MKATDKRYEKLFVRKDSSLSEPASHMFVDTAVYSRNRCFRLALSSKAGKTAFLVPTKRFMCKDMVSLIFSSFIIVVVAIIYNFTLGEWKLIELLVQ